MPRARRTTNQTKEAKTYNHQEETPQRPDIGTEAQFKKKKPPTTYRYDSSIAPTMEWDNNPVREEAEALIQQILSADDIESAKLAATKLKKLSQPFLNWTGKAERLSFDVPTLPLFVHERLSTRAIIETLKTHQVQSDQLSLFSDPQWSITDQILKAYEYKDKWVNRMIAGDSLVTMNSLTDSSIVRVCSPFTIEGTIPPPVDMEGEEQPESQTVEVDSTASFTDRMLEVLRQSPILHLPDNKTVELTNVRQPAKSQNISAEAMVGEQPVAFLFGSENGAIAERTVYETAKEANVKGYNHLYVIGFAISANARQFVENCKDTMGIPATYIQATPDLLMGDLLKNMRSSQIFSVCGLPDIKVHKLDDGQYQVELLGLDVFDPVTMDVDHEQGSNVPAWFLDTDYNGLCFYVRQAFFPRTSAWDSLQKALKGSYEESVWEHLAGTISSPFTRKENKEIAVKVIDDRGNELLVVKELK